MKLLIGGSPCTYWSIAQTKNRETEASGMGWELFKNYCIARDKFAPDYFLYENNKSMSAAIREQITKELGVEPVCINSALVSAQNRQRLYWCGKRNPDGTYSQVPIEQPRDRGILLRDILESGACWKEKGYTLRASSGGRVADSCVIRSIETGGKEACDGVAEPVNPAENGKAHTLKAQYYKNGVANFVTNGGFDATAVAEPVVVNPLPSGKSRTVDAHMGKLENNLVPRMADPNPNKQQYDCVGEPLRIGTIENDAKNPDHDSQQYRVYSPDAKGITLCGNGGGLGAKTGLYAVQVGRERERAA